jgi:uncharacterized protein YlxP (DUF503 family)
MVIGILQIELLIGHAQSLKDKRRVVSSLKDRLHRQFNVSVAEVREQDEHRRAVLGIVTVSNEVPQTQSVLTTIVEHLRNGRDFVLHSQQQEILSGR